MSDSNNPNRIIPSNVTELTLPAWLMRGAIREDDAYGEPNPQDDPYGANATLLRPLHHFYDPVFNRPLTVTGLSVFDSDVHTAPDWALGARGVFNTPNTPETSRRNHFTVFDAREAMYRALTGMSKTGSTLIGPGGTAATEAIRKAYWATTFRALGDMVHLLQDMAQPQHTRNEPHSGKGPAIAQTLATGHKSAFELYTDCRATGGSVQGTPPRTCRALTYGGYPIPTFNSYSDYFSTTHGGDVLVGKGMADYSNRGFFTVSHNLNPSNEYTHPSNNSADYGRETLAAPNGNITFFTGKVHDSNTNTDDCVSRLSGGCTVRMTTPSILNLYLVNASLIVGYSLNQYNYDDMADLLIPRAVAYSAGLINYFFRGRMQISLPNEGVYGIVDHSTLTGIDPVNGFKGFNKIKLKLKNISPPLPGQTLPESMAGGTLIAVLKFHRNTCYKDDLTGEPPLVNYATCRSAAEEIVVSKPWNNATNNVTLTNSNQEFSFDLPQALPINATDVYLQVVYRGPLGNETDAVVVATKDISEPTFFTYMNASDYILMYDKVYTRDQVNDPANNLLSQVYPQSCVDYQVNPPQLDSSCFQPFLISEHLTFGSTPTHIVITGLPVGQYFRFVYLADSDVGANINQFSGTCTPVSGPLTPLIWQMPTTYPIFPPVRGIYGWDTASCVSWGTSTSAPDNRNAVMAPLPAGTVPTAVQITGF